MAESIEQLDPTEGLTVDVVKKRAVKGAAILTGRNILIQGISFLAVALLTLFLEPKEFGVFFLVSAVINFLAYFGDIGFASALIQRRDSLTNIELRTVFTSQQILVLFILLIVFFATPFIKDFYKLETEAIYLLWAFAFSLLLSSLKTIPTVLMERRLEFNKWVIPQITEVVVFNIAAVYLAYKGFGVTSFTVAILLRSFSGLICTYLIQPWLPGISFSLQALKSILKFGLPYQANTLLAMVKDDGMILFLGGVLGTSGVGLLGWAQKWAYAPLRFFMDQIIKVTFPAFSRLQDNKKELSNAVSKSIFFVSFLVFPSLVFLLLAAPTLVEIIPKYSKWEPALFPLDILTITSALAAVTTPLTNTLNAIGKISITFRLMIMWTVLTWAFVPLLAISYGLNGAALGFTIVGLTSFIALFIISKYVSVDYLQSVGKPLVGSLLMGGVLFFIKTIIPPSFPQVILLVLAGFISYVLIMLILERNLLSMFKLTVATTFLFFLLMAPTGVFAQVNSFATVVNPIRGEDFWDIPNQGVGEAVKGQAEILKKFNISATWLMRFDALDKADIVALLKGLPQDEKGLFLEITSTWADAADVKYRRSDNWHAAGSAFLSGYERDERLKLIDSAFEKFKEIFGFYPKSVGAWWIDAYSLSYMEQKYGITASLIVADQYTTDNYQIWGQYFSTPYYPSKNNALHPANSLENKLSIVMMQWAPRDPINGYGDGVEQSTFSVQVNDYIDYHNLDINYFSSLVDIYTRGQFNKFGHLVVGLENSYDWSKYSNEYQKQIKVLVEKRDAGKLSIVPMRDFASWYQRTFPKLSPEHLILANDPLRTEKIVVWFMNPYYRAGWFINQDGSVFRDIRQYIEGEEEICFQKRCDKVNFATFATRVLDEVTYGHKWVIDDGKIRDFKLSKEGSNYVITYTNEAGSSRKISLLPKDIGIDGKITSIDQTILNVTRQEQISQKIEFQIEKGLFKWSAVSTLSKTVEFALFIIIACIIPGLVMTKKPFESKPLLLRLFLSGVTGFVMITLIFYLLSLLKIRPLIFLYLFINLIFFIRLKLYRVKIEIPRGWFNLASVFIILMGTIFQVIPTFKNGLIYPFGLGLWGPNTHDGVWHLSLINQLIKSVPPENPIFAATTLKNYHFFYDLLIAATNFLSTIPPIDLVFRFYPVIFSLMLGIGTYYLIFNLFKDKLAVLFGLYFVYFAGSFGWIVSYIKERNFAGESAFWANQSISFNLNPPFAISLLIIIALLHILFTFEKKIKNNIILAIILTGSLIGFKAYGAVLMLGSLLILGVIKRQNSYLLVFVYGLIITVLIFFANFQATSGLLIFAPFWFIHSMIDSPDRVGWVRLSLARQAGFETSNWFKFISVEALSLIIFIVGNLGLRVLSLGSFLRIKIIFGDNNFLFLLIFSTISFLIPILFIQSGNPWNTIQFSYYGLYIGALFAGAVLSYLFFKLPKFLSVLIILTVLILTPINSVVTATYYTGYLPHARVDQKELEALEFLSNQKDGMVLTFPYDKKIKQKITEPWPILAYDSTAYVAAFSQKPVYVEDEPQNQILLTDYKKRIVASKDFFSNPSFNGTKFLKDNEIKYMYVPKIYKISLGVSSETKTVFENEEIVIYEVNR